MSIVDLDDVEAGFESTLKGCDPGLFECLDVRERHSFRLGVLGVVRDGGGAVDLVGPAVYLGFLLGPRCSKDGTGERRG